MALQGSDLNSSSTTNATPWLLSCEWRGFRLHMYPTLPPRLSMFGLIQEFHSISTIPFFHHKYNEWLEMVEIGIWALKWSPQRGFQSPAGLKLAWPKSALFTPRFSKFGLIRKFHSISTLSITHCKYNEWLEKVEIGTHSLQPSPYSGF